MQQRFALSLAAVAALALLLGVWFSGGVIERPSRFLGLGQLFVGLEEQVAQQEQKVALALFALDDGGYEALLRAARNAALGSVPAAQQSIELQLREAFTEGKVKVDAKGIIEELGRLGPVEMRLQQQIEALIEGVGDGSLDPTALRTRRNQLLDTAREAREISGNCLALYQNTWPRALDRSVEQLADRQARVLPLILIALAALAVAAGLVFKDYARVDASTKAASEQARTSAAALEAVANERDQTRQSERRSSLELALLRLEQLSLTESLRSSLIITDTSLNARLINTAAKQAFGIDDASIGLPLGTLPALTELIVGLGGLPAVEQALAEGTSLQSPEIEARSHFYAARVTPFVDEAGKVRGLILLADDITQAIETRRRLMQSERLAAMGSMSAQVTHEIRNPLSAIALNADLLADELDDLEGDTTEAKTLLKAISREVERLTEVTGEYLRLSRLRPPAMHAEAVAPLVKELTEFLGEDLRRRRIELELQLGDGTVIADAAQLRQALMNILKNSMESMPNGGRLQVRSARQNGHVIVEVADNGVGIPEHILQRIFDPFYTTKEGGSGLGLPITQQIVAEHGGEVSAESEAGKGTRIRVSLPSA